MSDSAGRPTLVAVVRAHHEPTLRRLVEPALHAGWAIGLWELDGVLTTLGGHVVGRGPGERIALLDEAIRRVGTTSGPVILSDDDVVFVRGDVVELVRQATRAGLDVAQPAHAAGSRLSHPLTRVAPRSRARLTTFVEAGPVAVLGARWRDRLLPLPTDLGMGWGLELLWSDRRADGCRLGIVDAVRIRHVGEVGGEYETGPERERLEAMFAERGLETWDERTLATWRPWRRRPPWPTGDAASTVSR